METAKTENKMYELALSYLARGWSVLPCGKNKVPLVNWKQWQEKYPTESEIKTWFEMFPDAQVGIITGSISNLTVVDFEKGADPSEFPQETMIVSTGGSGYHYYYLYEEGITNKARIKPLIDVRSQGGFVVAAGSVSEKGPYTILQDVSLLPFPKELFPEKADIFQHPGTNTFEKRTLIEYPGHGLGQRNDEMARYIGYILTQVHPLDWETEGWQLIQQANLRNTPPLPPKELETTFESIKRIEKHNNPFGRRSGGFGPLNVPSSSTFETDPIILGDESDDIRHVADVADSQKIDQTDVYPLQMPCFDDVILGGVAPGDLVVVAGQTGHGKCLGKGTPVLMFDGKIKKVEDVVNGDSLMGPDSQPKKVTGVTSGIDILYSVVPVKGDPYVVNSDHVLSLRNTERKSKKIINISVRDFLKKSRTFKHLHKGWRSNGVSWREKEVLIDPYFLGLWLGDGNSNDLTISNPDKEVINYIHKVAKENNLVTKNTEKRKGFCPRFSLTKGTKKGERVFPLLKSFREYGLMPEKYIPEEYKTNSIEVRKQILAGLLDTDGYLDCNSYEIITKHERLRDDILFVARSLGLAAYSKKKISGIKSTGFKGIYHRILISGDTDILPLQIKRKKALPRRQIKNVLNTGLKITEIKRGKYYGFELDGDGLFLLGDFTVTHNTSLAQDWTISLIRGEKKPKSLWFSYEVLPTHLWEKFQSMGMTREDCVFTPARNSSGNITWVEQKIKEGKERFGIKMVMIDHLGFLLPKTQGILGKNFSSNYASFLTQVTRDLKSIALREEVIIFLPVHMRKAGQKGGGSDIDSIKDSSGISQEADLVFLIEREKAKDENLKSYFTDVTKITLAKNRKTGVTVIGKFNMINGRFAYNDDGERAEMEFQNFGK